MADAPAPTAEELLELYDDAMHRIDAVLSEEQRATLAEDPAVASVLLMHDLHPVSLGDRVAAALDSVAPYLDSHGGGVELVAIEDGIARLKLQGSCDGCGASQTTLELAIEEACRRPRPTCSGSTCRASSSGPRGRRLPTRPPTRSGSPCRGPRGCRASS